VAQPNSGGLRPIRHIVRYPLVEQELPRHDGAAPAAKPKPTCKSLDEYRNEAAAQINDPKQGANQDVRARNTRISGAYASLWMKDHDTFRWQGLAAHASTGVGMVMDLTNPKLQEDTAATLAAGHLPSWVPTGISGPLSSAKRVVLDAEQWVANTAAGRAVSGAGHWVGRQASDGAHWVEDSQAGRAVSSAAQQLADSKVGRAVSAVDSFVDRQEANAEKWVDDNTRLLGDAYVQKMMGDGNLAIYEKIMPASLAYAHGGMAELDCISGKLTGQEKRDFDKVRSSIADTSAGSALKKAGDAAGGERLVQDGVTKLVHIEQDDVIQSAVYDKNPYLSRVMGPAAFLQLSGDPTHQDSATRSWFWGSRDRIGASLGDQTQRDNWILNDVIPIWNKEVTQNTAETVRRMQFILSRGAAAGGHY